MVTEASKKCSISFTSVTMSFRNAGKHLPDDTKQQPRILESLISSSSFVRGLWNESCNS